MAKMNHFECPFKAERAAGKMCCDFEGCSHPAGMQQCPTEIFNACQAAASGVGLDNKPL